MQIIDAVVLLEMGRNLWLTRPLTPYNGRGGTTSATATQHAPFARETVHHGNCHARHRPRFARDGHCRALMRAHRSPCTHPARTQRVPGKPGRRPCCRVSDACRAPSRASQPPSAPSPAHVACGARDARRSRSPRERRSRPVVATRPRY
jgi:hypothetical protein